MHVLAKRNAGSDGPSGATRRRHAQPMNWELQMIKIYRSLAVLALGLMSAAVSAKAGANSDCSQLLAAGNSEYPPYLWPDKKRDNLHGANADILQAIGSKLGIRIEVKHLGSWARVQELAQSGDIDLVAGAFYTEPRTRYMEYIHPAFLETTSSVWVTAGAGIGFSGQDDLIGRSVTTVINNSFGQKFDEFARQSLNLNYVASLEQAYRMLAAGRTDFVLYEKQPGIAYAHLWNLDEQIALSGPSISSEGLYLTLSRKSPCYSKQLVSRLKHAIEQLSEAGQFQKALENAQNEWIQFNQHLR
jgi:polar amino acid transport system substrate-binding protein